MTKSILKKTIISSVLILLVGTLIWLGVKKDSNLEYQPLAYAGSVFDVASEQDDSYRTFLAASEKTFPTTIHEVDLQDYSYENGLFEEDIPKYENYRDDQGKN